MHPLLSDYLKKQKQSPIFFFRSICHNQCVLNCVSSEPLACQQCSRSMQKSTKASILVLVFAFCPLHDILGVAWFVLY